MKLDLKEALKQSYVTFLERPSYPLVVVFFSLIIIFAEIFYIAYMSQGMENLLSNPIRMLLITIGYSLANLLLSLLLSFLQNVQIVSIAKKALFKQDRLSSMFSSESLLHGLVIVFGSLVYGLPLMLILIVPIMIISAVGAASMQMGNTTSGFAWLSSFIVFLVGIVVYMFVILGAYEAYKSKKFWDLFNLRYIWENLKIVWLDLLFAIGVMTMIPFVIGFVTNWVFFLNNGEFYSTLNWNPQETLNLEVWWLGIAIYVPIYLAANLFSLYFSSNLIGQTLRKAN